MYADIVQKSSPEQVEAIVPRSKWLCAVDCDARFVSNGHADSCIDPELQQIDNSLIDDISHVINEEYDKLFEIETDAEGEQ